MTEPFQPNPTVPKHQLIDPFHFNFFSIGTAASASANGTGSEIKYEKFFTATLDPKEIYKGE
jgi:hypothetical protein